MDAREFLDTAQFLHDEGEKEADFRSAISRAYYACFLDTRELLLSMGCDLTGRRDTHTLVRSCFKGYSPSQKMREVDTLLRRLHDQRRRADYDIGDKDEFNASDAELAITTAEQIIAIISECLSDPAFYNQVQTSATAYLASLAPQAHES